MPDSEAVNFPNEAASFSRTKKVSANQTTDGRSPAAIFQRIAAGDLTAVRECLDTHGNLVWALARKFTDSTEDAETMTEEIFLDIWKYASRFAAAKTCEEKFIIWVACRCLIKSKTKPDSAVATTRKLI